MTQGVSRRKEQLSAFLDGELSEHELYQMLKEFEADEESKKFLENSLNLGQCLRDEKLILSDRNLSNQNKVASHSFSGKLESNAETPFKKQKKVFSLAQAGVAASVALVALVISFSPTPSVISDQLAVSTAEPQLSSSFDQTSVASFPITQKSLEWADNAEEAEEAEDSLSVTEEKQNHE